MTDSHEFVETFLKKLRETKSNAEFLETIQIKDPAKRPKTGP